MMPVVFAIICAISAGIFIWSEYKWEKKRTILLKGISSLMFVAVGVSGFIVNSEAKTYGLLIVAGLVMGLIGDILLGLKDTYKRFVYGLSAFLIGHVIYAAAFVKYNGLKPYDAVIYVVLIIAYLSACKKCNLHLGKTKLPAFIYMLVIAFMYSMALSSVYKGGFNLSTTVMIAVGASFFAASDTILGYGRFKENAKSYLRGINLTLYYSGQILLALSVVTFG